MTTHVHERLRRLLVLVPFVSRNPGRSVDEVARTLGITRDELMEELDLLTLVGRPPFQPDDFVDIYVEDDRVYVDLDQRFSAPPRLTAVEAAALAAAARLLKPGPSDALGTAVSKLEGALPKDALERYRELAKRLDVTIEAPEWLPALSKAVLEHRVVTFEYTASGTETRRVRPFELFSHLGRWYLSGFDEGRAAERLFRLDRMGPPAVTDATFTPPEHTRRDLPTVADASERVTVRFEAASAPYVRERFGADVRGLSDGRVEVEVPGDNLRWLTRWVLTFGGDAVVTSPPWAITRVAEAAAQVLDRG